MEYKEELAGEFLVSPLFTIFNAVNVALSQKHSQDYFYQVPFDEPPQDAYVAVGPGSKKSMFGVSLIVHAIPLNVVFIAMQVPDVEPRKEEQTKVCFESLGNQILGITLC